MSFPIYSDYVDSPIHWLHKQPSQWSAKPVKTIATINDETLSDSVNPEHEIEYVDIGSVSLTNGIEKTEAMAFGESPSRARRVPREGDVLVSTVRTYLKAIAPVVNQPSNLVASTGFAVIRPRPELEPGFLKYALQEEHFIQEVISRSTGVSYPAINASDIGRVLVCFPNQDEQLAIANFLDRETAKIDALIAEQQRLIELLQEKRQAVISHAVTKGLNPDAPMKDSGVEWLGEVPEHWEVRPFKSEIFFQEGPGIMAVDFMDEGIPLLRVSCVQGQQVTLDGCNYLNPHKVAQKWAHFMVAEGDLLLSGSASLGGVSEVGKEAAGSIPYTGLIRVRPLSTKISREFIRLLIESSSFSIQIDRLKAGATIQHFGPTHLRQMKITLPPPDEQELITHELARAKSAFDGLVKNAQQAIALLQERRSALISAAVTGQIDVRGLATEEAA